jgi:hypothetical protein
VRAARGTTTNNGDTITGGRAEFIDTEDYEDLKNTAKEKLLGEYGNNNTREFYTKRFRYWLAWCDDREDVNPQNPEEDDLKKLRAVAEVRGGEQSEAGASSTRNQRDVQDAGQGGRR